MFTRQSPLLFLTLLVLSPAICAHDHDATMFHAFRLELDAGESRDNESMANWNLDGWMGGDDNKLWLKSEGAVVNHKAQINEN